LRRMWKVTRSRGTSQERNPKGMGKRKSAPRKRSPTKQKSGRNIKRSAAASKEEKRCAGICPPGKTRTRLTATSPSRRRLKRRLKSESSIVLKGGFGLRVLGLTFAKNSRLGSNIKKPAYQGGNQKKRKTKPEGCS